MNDLSGQINSNLELLNTLSNESTNPALITNLNEIETALEEVLQSVNNLGTRQAGGKRRRRKTKRKHDNRKRKTRKYKGGWKYKDSDTRL